MSSIEHQSRPLIVVGAGGHATVLIDTLQRLGRTLVGAIEAVPTPGRTAVLGVAVLGSDEVLQDYPPGQVDLVCGIGSVAPGSPRVGVYEQLAARGYRFCQVVHPAAVVSDRAQLGAGAQVMAGAVVQPGAVVGDNAILNTGCLVDHDCQIEAHAQVAPGAVLCGAVRVGRGAHVGAGATVVQGVRIGAGAMVYAGAVVIHPVPAGQRVAGVPAIVLGARDAPAR